MEVTKLAKRAGYIYWLYVDSLTEDLAEHSIITYDKYNGRELLVQEITPYTIESSTDYRVEGASYKLVCQEIADKVLLENYGVLSLPPGTQLFTVSELVGEVVQYY